MPDPKNNAKLTGDTHPPEVEDLLGRSPEDRPEAAGAHSTPPDDAFSRDVHDAGREGKKVEQAGSAKDKDAPGAGGQGHSER
jgi:hypothetical protein